MKHIKKSIVLLVFSILIMAVLPVQAATSKTTAKTAVIRLVDHNGKEIKVYRVKVGSTITLPKLSNKVGWKHSGWNVAKNKKLANFTTTFKVDKSRNLYESGQKITVYTVKYMSASGSKTLSTRQCNENSTIRTPELANTSTKRFLGWATQPNQTRPNYISSGNYKVTANVKLYAVYYKVTEDKDSTLNELNFNKYSAIVFVGDSRTSYMKQALTIPENVFFVNKSGSKLDWLKTEGYTKLLNIVQKSHDKPIAIVFNHGVNDLRRPTEDTDIDEVKIANTYAKYYNSIAPVLQSYNCKLFFESVNPINKAALLAANMSPREPVEIERFNIALRTEIAQYYTFINTNVWMQYNGYVTLNPNTGIDDGLHYSNATSIRLYNRIIECVNRY